jgi:hypothetical protein
MPDPNLPLLEDAVHKLAPFLNEIVFIGGITLGLLITDKAAAPIRGTNDVDVIAEIVTYADYIVFSERLRNAHFTEDDGEKPLTCRWHHGELTVDVLALNEEVLGFSNIWYESALRHAFPVTLPSGQSIRVITAPFFLGTKMEAFRGRGKMDFQASHDLEDFVAVIEGRDSLLQEVAVLQLITPLLPEMRPTGWKIANALIDGGNCFRYADVSVLSVLPFADSFAVPGTELCFQSVGSCNYRDELDKRVKQRLPSR